MVLQYTLCESPTLLLWVIRHKQLIERVDVVGSAPPHRSVVAVGGELQHHLVIPQWVRRLGLVDHEWREEEGLDEPNVALLLEVRSHFCPSKHVAQQLRFNLGRGKTERSRLYITLLFTRKYLTVSMTEDRVSVDSLKQTSNLFVVELVVGHQPD